jgi:hypothetical protein
MRAVAAVVLVLILGVSGAAYAYAGPVVARVFTPAQALLGGVLAPAGVPEPASLSLFGAGLFGSAFILRRRRRMKACSRTLAASVRTLPFRSIQTSSRNPIELTTSVSPSRRAVE